MKKGDKEKMILEARELIKKPERVLVVEDDPEYQEIFGDALSSRGLNFRIVASAKEAEKVLREEEFERVITDGLGGECRLIVKLAQERNLPIKVVSGDLQLKNDLCHEGLKGLTFVNKAEATDREELKKL